MDLQAAHGSQAASCSLHPSLFWVQPAEPWAQNQSSFSGCGSGMLFLTLWNWWELVQCNGSGPSPWDGALKPLDQNQLCRNVQYNSFLWLCIFSELLQHPWGYLTWVTITLAPGKVGQPAGTSAEPKGFGPVFSSLPLECVGQFCSPHPHWASPALLDV